MLERGVIAHDDADELGHTALRLGKGIDAVAALEPDVEDRDVRARSLDTFERVVVIRRLAHHRMGALDLDHFHQALAKRRRVLDQKDPHAALGMSCLHGPQYGHWPVRPRTAGG